MNIAETNKIKFAIPSKGRLKDPAIELLKKAGYKFRASGRNLYATCTNADIIFIFVRTDDIPILVNSGVCDLGITGQDLVLEHNVAIQEILPLGFGKCRLCVAVRDSHENTDLSYFHKKNIATSFPTMTTDFFKRNNIDINCIEMSGSVEIMVGLHLAEAIVDIVETGDSLRDNNLKVLCDIGSYETVLIASNEKKHNEEIEKIRRRIEGVIVASQYSLLEYNIPRNKLEQAEKITPGFESPTVSKLEDSEWAAVRVMVKKKEVVQAMDELEELGATAIIETDISNCRL